ncbi:hypothetical protein [Paenibacillus sp. YN15]|uniref:hypothetical protein n=1 Tax=Paenibacillus sp. YN15 TaxID=1742774 RepID=UPI000DCCDA74|nr:hypothetical protein [Paenibacillus sp. YN15]RAU96784.1 hypothetical protein DQG13_19690 [Paenibacillus sp. YN15]
MGRLSIMQAMRKYRNKDRISSVLDEWLAGFQTESTVISRKIVASMRRGDYDVLCRALGGLKEVMRKHFAACPNVIKALYAKLPPDDAVGVIDALALVLDAKDDCDTLSYRAEQSVIHDDYDTLSADQLRERLVTYNNALRRAISDACEKIPEYVSGT